MYTTPDGRKFMLFECLDDLLEALGETFRAPTPEARDRDGYIFRGHADAAWSLQPTLLREPKTADLVAAREAYTRSFVEQLRLARKGLSLPGSDELSLYAVAQHYGFPTTLLDFSYSFEVAAAFANDNTSSAEFGVVFQFSRKEVDDLKNPLGAVGLTQDATDEVLAKVGLITIPPLTIVSLPTVERVKTQEGLFFSLRANQVMALERDCIDRYYFRHEVTPHPRLSLLYASLFPADERLDAFVLSWKAQHPSSRGVNMRGYEGQ